MIKTQSKKMIIIIGLGNPGKKFEETRHNAGFMVLDVFAEKNNFPDFDLCKKCDSLVSEKDGILLVKPQTFMNESGKAVKKLIINHKPITNNLIVIHDDIDLPLGKIKFSKDSGSGGHKGVDSIIKSVGKENMTRLRLGICPLTGKPKNVEKFVIQKFKKEEAGIMTPAIENAAESLDFYITNGLEKTMNKYNG